MRALPVTVTAVFAALLLLTACDDGTPAEGKGKAEDRKPAVCETGQVRLEAGPASTAPADGDTGEVPVTVLNEGGTCVLDGTPEVFLAGASDSETVEVPLTEGARPQEITLAEGDSTSFVVTYVRGTSFNPADLHFAVTPGPETKKIPWTYGGIAPTDGGGYEMSVSTYQQTGD
ncbi:DUF4232 domain-containing protein [Streptomyces sp. NPDC055058]